jgi:hypothetical protein
VPDVSAIVAQGVAGVLVILPAACPCRPTAWRHHRARPQCQLPESLALPDSSNGGQLAAHWLLQLDLPGVTGILPFEASVTFAGSAIWANTNVVQSGSKALAITAAKIYFMMNLSNFSLGGRRRGARGCLRRRDFSAPHGYRATKSLCCKLALCGPAMRIANGLQIPKQLRFILEVHASVGLVTALRASAAMYRMLRHCRLTSRSRALTACPQHGA